MSEHDEITASMLHELREPVQAIRGFLAIILAERAGPLTDVQRDFLSSANRAAVRLERLVRDIDVRSQVGNLSLIPKRLNLLSSVNACVAELRPMANELDVAIRIETRTAENLEILADQDRIDQILVNLLENALRYGDSGKPIRVSLRGGKTRVLCMIENAIPDQTQQQNSEEWFHPYTRQGGDREQVYATGQGLGLCVVTRLVHAHRGRVLTRISRERVCIGFVLPRDIRPRSMPLRNEGLHDFWRVPENYLNSP